MVSYKSEVIAAIKAGEQIKFGVCQYPCEVCGNQTNKYIMVNSPRKWLPVHPTCARKAAR
jgi:hypothetical protein